MGGTAAKEPCRVDIMRGWLVILYNTVTEKYIIINHILVVLSNTKIGRRE